MRVYQIPPLRQPGKVKHAYYNDLKGKCKDAEPSCPRTSFSAILLSGRSPVRKSGGMRELVITVTMYTRPGCCLCREAREVLDDVRRSHSFRLLEVDISSDRTLQALYGEEIPVVLVEDRKAFKFRVDPRRLLRQIREAEAKRGRWRVSET